MQIQEQKYELLRGIFNEIGAIFIFENYFGTDLAEEKEDELIRLISSHTYSIKEYKSASIEKTRALIQDIFPDKPQSSNQKLDIWILAKFGYKYCRMCDTVKLLTDFTLNKSKAGGLNVQCKLCQKEQTAKTQPARQAKYRAAGLRAIVPWSDLEEISKYYSKCPEGYQVDHIVPLQGNNVSGLHVINNLQYLTKEDNLKKHNKYIAGGR